MVSTERNGRSARKAVKSITMDFQPIVIDFLFSFLNKKRYNWFKAGHPVVFIGIFARHYYDFADTLIAFKQDKRRIYIEQRVDYFQSGIC